MLVHFQVHECRRGFESPPGSFQPKVIVAVFGDEFEKYCDVRACIWPSVLVLS